MSATTAPVATGGPSPAASLPAPLDRRQREVLLGIARTSVLLATGRASVEALTSRVAGAPAVAHAGVFVTLTSRGALRGCMGVVDPDVPLGRAVALAAIRASTGDPRFPSLAAYELADLCVEVSVLAPPHGIAGPADFAARLDGVILERHGRRALLLPEVAVDRGWGAEEMFDAVTAKAGFREDAWRSPDARLLAFRTVRFGGPALDASPATLDGPAARACEGR